MKILLALPPQLQAQSNFYDQIQNSPFENS
jgi:hypothetical protein